MTPSNSMTRARTTGKCASGATSMVAGSSLTGCMQVSDGSPFTCIPQLPHTAMRHDQRCESVPSISSLMKFSASSTFQSDWHGTS